VNAFDWMDVKFLVEERRLPSHLPGHLDFRQRINTPEIAERIDRPRTVPRVVVICKSQNHDSPQTQCQQSHLSQQCPPFSPMDIESARKK
jgi:hypothetical protein